MSEGARGAVSRLLDRVFPRMPDFFGLLNEQCDLVVQTMGVFIEYMEDADEDKAKQVRKLEHQGDALKRRNTVILSRAFSTPIDREDIMESINSIDQLINYAKTTVREMEVLSVQPDKYMLEIAVFLKSGVEALQRGYRKLSENPALAEQEALAARKAERNVEKVYRRALQELFNVEGFVQELENRRGQDQARAFSHIIDIFKRREIYRHLNNAADHLASTGDRLHDIVVKVS